MFGTQATSLLPRFDFPREEALGEEEWNSFKDEEGRIIKEDEVKHIIFKGVRMNYNNNNFPLKIRVVKDCSP